MMSAAPLVSTASVKKSSGLRSPLDAKRMATPFGVVSPHATYSVPLLSTFTGRKFHSVSKADPVLPVLGTLRLVQVRPAPWPSAAGAEREIPTPPPLPPPFWR